MVLNDIIDRGHLLRGQSRLQDQESFEWCFWGKVFYNFL